MGKHSRERCRSSKKIIVSPREEREKIRQSILKVFEARLSTPGKGGALLLGPSTSSKGDSIVTEKQSHESVKSKKEVTLPKKRNNTSLVEPASGDRDLTLNSSPLIDMTEDFPVLKTKRRRTRAERNRIKNKQPKITKEPSEQHTLKGFKEQMKRMDKMNRQPKGSSEKMITILGSNRLTRRLGLFNQGIKSMKILRDRDSNVPSCVRHEAEMDMCPSSSDVFHVGVSGHFAGSASRPERTPGSAQSCHRRPLKQKNDFQPVTRNHSPMIADEKKQAVFPESPPVKAVSSLLLKGVNIKKLFPGKDYCETLREDLYKTMSSQLISPNLSSHYHTPAGSSMSAPSSTIVKRNTPSSNSHCHRASLSCKTGMKLASTDKNMTSFKMMDTDEIQSHSNSSTINAEKIHPGEDDQLAGNMPESRSCTPKPEPAFASLDQRVSMPSLSGVCTYGQQDQQPPEQTLGSHLDSLLEADDLLDYNNQLRKGHHSMAQGQILHTNPLDLSSRTGHVHLNDAVNLQHVRSLELQHPQGSHSRHHVGVNMDQDRGQDVQKLRSHHCATTKRMSAGGAVVLPGETSRSSRGMNMWLNQSVATSANHVTCETRHPLMTNLSSNSALNLSLPCKAADHSRPVYNGRYSVGDDLWIPPLKQRQPDLLDYIDSEVCRHSDVYTDHSRLCHPSHQVAVDSIVQHWNCEPASHMDVTQAHSRTDSAEEASIWYPSSNQLKPRMDTPSPQKLLPHRLF